MIQVVVIVFLIRLFILSLNGYYSAKEKLNSSNYHLDKLQILIPVKNEESRIEEAIHNLLKLKLSKEQVLILNDCSSDKTLNILEKHQEHFIIINGENKPNSWNGKNWACHQLSQIANSEFILFTDIDVTLSRNGLNEALNYLNSNKLSMLSVFPHQLERNIMDNLFNRILFTSLLYNIVLKWIPTIKSPSYSAAIGQFLLFRRSSYNNYHFKLKESWIEDVEIMRLLKKDGKKTASILSKGSISCQMYEKLEDGINGFSKNFFAGFNFKVLPMIFFLLLNLATPLALIYFAIQLPILLFLVFLELIVYTVISRSGLVYNLANYVTSIVIWLWISLKSIYWKYSNNISWR